MSSRKKHQCFRLQIRDRSKKYHHHYQQHPELASQCLGLPIFQGAGFQQSAATTPGTAVLVLPTQPDGQTQDTSDLGGCVQTQAPVMYNSSNVQ
ncbi:unnamed protein product, partial [Brassica oleracea]